MPGQEDQFIDTQKRVSVMTSAGVTEEDRHFRRQLANSNERRRMQSINRGFENVKKLLPFSGSEKISKSAILQHAAQYIRTLVQENSRMATQNSSLEKLVAHLMSGADNLLPAELRQQRKRDSESSAVDISASTSFDTDEILVEKLRAEVVDLKLQLQRERNLRLMGVMPTVESNLTESSNTRQQEPSSKPSLSIAPHAGVTAKVAENVSKRNLNMLVAAIRNVEGDGVLESPIKTPVSESAGKVTVSALTDIEKVPMTAIQRISSSKSQQTTITTSQQQRRIQLQYPSAGTSLPTGTNVDYRLLSADNNQYTISDQNTEQQQRQQLTALLVPSSQLSNIMNKTACTVRSSTCGTDSILENIPAASTTCTLLAHPLSSIGNSNGHMSTTLTMATSTCNSSAPMPIGMGYSQPNTLATGPVLIGPLELSSKSPLPPNLLANISPLILATGSNMNQEKVTATPSNHLSAFLPVSTKFQAVDNSQVRLTDIALPTNVFATSTPDELRATVTSVTRSSVSPGFDSRRMTPVYETFSDRRKRSASESVSDVIDDCYRKPLVKTPIPPKYYHRPDVVLQNFS